MPELKSCPFCGCEPCLWSNGKKWYVDCQQNDCQVNPGTWNELNKEQAIEAWNTRS